MSSTPKPVLIKQFKLGISPFKRKDDGSESMNIDGDPTGTPVVVWNGTGAGDTGGDWTHEASGTETAGSMRSGTNGLDTGVQALSDKTRFDNGADLDINGIYTTLRFWMNPQAFPVGAKLKVKWRNLATTVIGTNLNVANYVSDFDTGVWQQVDIPIEDFLLTGDVSEIVLTYANAAGQHFYFDDFELIPPGGGPYKFRIQPPAGENWHIEEIKLVIAAGSTGWDSSAFGNITGGLTSGLLLKHLDPSATPETIVHWKSNTKSNVELWGRYCQEADVSFSNPERLFVFTVQPSLASVLVTPSEVIDFVVRDDLSSLANLRAFAHYGIEDIPA